MKGAIPPSTEFFGARLAHAFRVTLIIRPG
jgi:hypothetical protein